MCLFVIRRLLFMFRTRLRTFKWVQITNGLQIYEFVYLYLFVICRLYVLIRNSYTLCAEPGFEHALLILCGVDPVRE